MNAISWSGRAWLFTFPKHTSDIASSLTVSVMYITDNIPQLAHNQGSQRKEILCAP